MLRLHARGHAPTLNQEPQDRLAAQMLRAAFVLAGGHRGAHRGGGGRRDERGSGARLSAFEPRPPPFLAG